MNSFILFCAITILLFSGCQKSGNVVNEHQLSTSTSFIKYTIRKGEQYSDQSSLKTVEMSEMKFVVKFDSTAIYQTISAENQNDINKLYGFSDNNSAHHQYSARFGWRWSSNFLRLFAYIYNEGVVSSKELAIISIGTEVSCSIQVTNSSYLFTVNGVTERLPRMASTAKGQGYQLYPYFGGDEAAPHDVYIWIKPVL